MKCPVCGSDIERGKRICDVCGSDLARRTQHKHVRGQERLPYDPNIEIDEAKVQRSAVTELKETKAAYKEARRNAGKTNTPKILAIIVAVIIAAGAAAGVTWYVMTARSQAEIAAIQAQLDDAQAQITEAKEEAATLRKELSDTKDLLEKYEKALAEEVVQNSEKKDADNESQNGTAAGSNAGSSTGSTNRDAQEAEGEDTSQTAQQGDSGTSQGSR